MNQSGLMGRPVWCELMTTDTNAAQSFYTSVLGWSAAPFGSGQPPYTLWMRGEKAVGGVMDMPEGGRKAGAPPHWLIYLGTPDVDATVRQALGLGATTLVPPTDIPSVGRFAVLSDPQGAVFAAFTPSTTGEGTDRPPEIGEFSWYELATSDEGAAFRFYSAVFGWQQTEAMDMGPMGIYRMYGQPGGRTLGGIYTKPADHPGPPHWLTYVRVDDVGRVGEVVKQRNGQVINGPMEVPGGDWIAQCLDPHGAAFAIHHKPS